MRHRGTYWTIAVVALVFGISVGCAREQAKEQQQSKFEPNANLEKDKKNQPAPEKQFVVREPDQEIVKNEPAGNVGIKPVDVEIVGAGRPFFVPDEVVKGVDGAPGIAVRETDPTPRFPIDAKDTKKKDKDKDKEPPTKDPSKEPKFEYKEPTEIDGKTWDQWMKIADITLKNPEANDPVRREEAYKHLVAFGPTKAYHALPVIIKDLKRHYPPTSKAVDLSVRVNGMIAMSTIFKMMMINKKELDARGHKISEKELEEAFDLYKKGLKDPQVIMRVRAVQGLPYLGPIARKALGDVLAVSKDPISWEVRKEGMQTLVMIAPDASGKPDTDVIKELRLRAVGTGGPNPDTSYLVRQTALTGLVMLSDGKSIPPELYKALDTDKAVEVRLTVLNLIQQLGKELKDDERPNAVKHLKAHVAGEKDEILKIWTYATLMSVTQKVSAAYMDPVLKYLNNPNQAVELQALTVVGLGGKDSKPFALTPLKNEVDRWLKELDKKRPDLPEPNIALGFCQALAQMHAVEMTDVFEKIENHKNAPEFLKVSVGKALDAFADVKEMEDQKKKEKDKKTPDKKTPDKK